LFESLSVRGRPKSVKALLAWTLVAVLWTSTASAKEEPVTYYIQTIVGTNRAQESAEWKKVGPQLQRELSPVFQWKHYWQVSCQKISVEKGKVSRVRLTKVRELDVAIREDAQLELRLYRDGKLVRKLKDLVSHRLLVMGGDSSKDEAWFVVVRRDKPSIE
jgi:hypothetical protein